MWKWGLFALLLLVLAVLTFDFAPLRRYLGVHAKDFAVLTPPRDGSSLYLVISLLPAQSGKPAFHASVRLLAPTLRHESPVNEFQVDLASGVFLLRQTDLFVRDVIPLALTRTYRSWDSRPGALGIGTNLPYDICPTGSHFPYTYMDLNLEDGHSVRFRRLSPGAGYADAVFGHDSTSSEFFGAQVAWNGNGWTLSLRDGGKLLFPDSYLAKSCAQGAPFEIQDAQGHQLLLKRDARRNLQQLIGKSGHAISFAYDEVDRITVAKDDAGNIRRYTYDATGHLEKVWDCSRLLYRSEYAPLIQAEGYDPYLMTAFYDGDGQLLVKNSYADGSRVSELKLANGDVYRFEYIFRGNEIVQTIFNGPSGQRIFLFDHGVLKGER